jgi:hypothetical protein
MKLKVFNDKQNFGSRSFLILGNEKLLACDQRVGVAAREFIYKTR